MSDREFWIVIRRALLLVVDVIERRYNIGKHEQKGQSDV